MAKKRQLSIEDIWRRVESWVHDNWPTDETLPPGATRSEIGIVEAAFEVKLPNELVNCYKIHNGSGKITLLPIGDAAITFPLLSLPGIVSLWKNFHDAVLRGYFSGPDFVNKPKGPIKKVWFHDSWIPIVYDQSGDSLFVDMSPTKGGKRGQIIDFVRHAGATNVVAASIADLLNQLASDLEAGKYNFDKKTNSLVKKSKPK